MDMVKMGWSGGKDSTCGAYKRLYRGDLLKLVCYIPRFTEDIPLINKEHYEFILGQADKFTQIGGQVYFPKGITYYDYCLSICKSGINKGQVKGYPYINSCGFRRDSKIKAVSECEVGEFDYLDLAIAYDEKDRQGQLNDKVRSILVEEKITEKQAEKFCIEHNAYSPHYKYSKRDGCALCFNAKPIERYIWLNDYPQAQDKLLELQNILNPLLVGRKNEYPLRGYKHFIETLPLLEKLKEQQNER
jgi:hypothetical protein